jgi:predicted N-formylglutamate amidohydrolase
VPGNIGLSERHQLARVREIFRPYHDRIATELDRRREAARPTALISVHSFTPVFKTVARLWHVGVLYNRDPRFAQILMELLHREEGLVLGDNEPYSVTDASDLYDPRPWRAAGLAPCGTRNSPSPHHGRSGSTEIGGVVCAIASASL